MKPILIYWKKQHILVLIFLLSCIKTLKSLHPDQFDDYHWLEISHLLPSTSPELLKYKWISLTHRTSKYVNSWNFKDDYILMEIISENEPSLLAPHHSRSKVKWSRIAMKFNHQSKNNKLGKHCKERWLNHLSPHLNKAVWTDEDDILLIENAIIHNKKWVKIASFFPGRTQHHVKNRFLSLIARENKISTKKLSFKEGRCQSMILRTLCSLKRRFDFIKKNQRVLNDHKHKNSELDENIERFYKNDKDFSQSNKNPQIIQENPSTEENWFETNNFNAEEYEKFEEMCFEKKMKWEEAMANDGKEIDLFLENLEMF